MYLCNECAEERGGVWPKGHMATFHEGPCGYCKAVKALAHWTDWDWPGTTRDALAKLWREF